MTPIPEADTPLRKKDVPYELPQLDSTEPMVLVTFMLPYKLQVGSKGEFKLIASYSNPTMLFASLENYRKNKQFNFLWVGGVVTEQPLTDEQRIQAIALFKSKNQYPVFFTHDEILLYF
jgi:hypothetical protein